MSVQTLSTLAARKDEDDKMKFTDLKKMKKKRTEDKVIAEETDRQGTRHLSCQGALLTLLHYFHISRSPHLLANQAELNILNYLS